MYSCVVVWLLFQIMANGAISAPQDEGIHTLRDQVDLARLIDLCAERLELNIEYDPRALQGASVTLRVGKGITDGELWLVTNHLLTARGFAAVQIPGSDLISITKIAGAGGLARLETDVEDGQAGYVSLLYEMKHRSAAEVADVIKPLLSKPGGTVVRLGKDDLLLMSDYRPRIDQAIQLVERIDIPAEEATIETVPVEYLAASQLSGLVNSTATAYAAVSGTELTGKLIASPDGSALILVAPQSEIPRWRSMIERFDRREAIQTRSYAPRHFSVQEVARLVTEVTRDRSPRGSGDQWRMITDELTGTLIVTATPSEHTQVEALIERLDSVPQSSRRPVRAFPIRNRSVNDILDVVQRLIEAGVLEGSSIERPDTDDTRTRDRPMTQTGTVREVLPPGAVPVQPPGVAPEPAPEDAPLGRPERPAAARGDAPPLTITADEGTNTLIAVGEARRLDQLAELIETLDVRQAQVMLEVLVVNLTDADTLDLGVELEKLEISGSTLINLASLFGLGTAGLEESETPTGAGGTALVLSPGDFRILIRALETINQGRLLNTPKVLVSNNQEAKFNSLRQEPFASVNASNTVATTSFGGTQDAGTSIAVRPQIAEGDHLLLEYTVTLSTFVGESTDPTLPPPRLENTLSSVATIPDGYTVVIGGLETFTEAEAVSQVPLLGSIPIIGEAFKNRSSSTNRSHYYVFIRPDVLRQTEFEDLKFMSDRDARAGEIDDGWPEVKPRVIK